MEAYKIFRHFTTSDSTFVNRLGDEVKIAPFWTILLINVGEADEINICDILNIDQPLFPMVKYVQTNGFVEPLSNDPLYPTQQSLMSVNYPDGHINIEPAWAIETGSDNIKIGVLDSGIKWDHEDFGGSFASFGTKVKGGYDYATESSLKFTANNGDPLTGFNAGHGTAVTGIIGGLKNNSLGLAGIAGGNWPYANVPPGDGTQQDPLPAEHNIGPVLHGFRILDAGLTMAETVSAMADASVWTPLYPESMDIINNSWRSTTSYSYDVNGFLNNNYYSMFMPNLYQEVQRQIFRSGVINVCSRGNTGVADYHFPNYSEQEEWVISVGGSDKDGFKHPGSSFGVNVDLIAPFDIDIVKTIQNNTTNSYGDFDGTSASAPHVTGVAALMLSHIDWQPTTPNNLAPDDVEFLLQRYARDIVADPQHPNYQVGEDELSGWGLLDAGAVMEKIDRTQYIIKHVKAEIQLPSSLSGVPQITGSHTYSDINMPYDDYQATIYEVSFTLQNNINTGDTILDYWALNSYTTLLDNDINSLPTFLNREEGQIISSMNNTNGVVKGTVIHLTQDGNGNAINYWYPAAPGELVKVGYTLHLKSDYAGVKENYEQVFNLSCYPNPSSEDVTVNFVLSEFSDVQLEVFDINGRLVYKNDKSDFPLGEHSIKINSNPWTKGMYFIKLKANETAKTIKFIKQ